MKMGHPVLRTGPRQPMDWAKVRRRMEDTQSVAEHSFSPAGEEKRRILKARAVALAREQAPAKQQEAVEVVTFLLADETYGIEARWVDEIFALRELTPLPWNPPFFAGLVNLRGKVLPVVDIKKLFDLPEKGLTDLNKVLVLHHGDLELGILADQVLELRSVPVRAIQASLPTLTGIRGEFLKGVTAERLILLDAEKILTDSRLSPDGSAEE